MSKNLKSPGLHTKDHGRRKYFFQGRKIVTFSRWWPNAFSRGGPAVVKFQYTNSKVKEKHFSTKKLLGKYEISNLWGLAVTLVRLLMFCS